ncbi:FAD-dependent monooxygenase [Agromyces ramosus]|uniref:FAD-dependent monooxygenase n=1 Tax=Agromyces ramosus TaxID=33879 RepID=UPI0027D79613|nr:FAD-dependent monooxygenase [Agromyces ramosus]
MSGAAGTPATISTDVLVVGAGPSGLMLAVCLAKLGVDVVIVDGKEGPTRESRALAVQARSMELYDQLGLVDRVLAERSSATAVVPGAGSRPFGRVELRGLGEGVSPFMEITVFEQSRNERMLVAALGDLGRDVRWGHRLERLEVLGATSGAGASVMATLTGPDGNVTAQARYCVGADGSHSPVRESLGIPFEGVTNEASFYVADASGVTGLVEGAVNIRVTAEHFLLAFPMGPARMRLLGVVRDRDRDADGELREASVRALVRREFGVEYTDSGWFATYRLHHRLAARFRDGPCFLVGDAAHIHSPVGAQGMNTGLQEAHNLACALADVLVGGMPDTRLDRYQAERRPVGETLVATTDRAFGVVTADSALARFIRGRVVPVIGPLAIRLLPRVVGGRRVFGYLSQTRIHYRMSRRESAGRRRDPVVGRRLPWTGANFDVLRSMTWQVHGYGVFEPEVQAIAESLGLEAHAFPPDPHRRLQPGLVYLVRPDGFVAAAASARAVPGGPPAFREQLAG